MAEITYAECPEQPTAVLHEKVALDALPQFLGRAFGAVASVLVRQDVEASGMPFAYYHSTSEKVLDVEAGFPVSGPIAAEDGVVASRLPQCHAAEVTHVGPYDALPVTYRELSEGVRAAGHTPREDMWELYVTDPQAEPDAAHWRTLVVQPLD